MGVVLTVHGSTIDCTFCTVHCTTTPINSSRNLSLGFLTSESVRGHHDENFEWSQAEPLSKDERARAFLRFLDFSARNLQGKTEIQILDF